ncbi:hypothetical protein SEEA3871_08235, partial [Salmonella enterica subsp. enterica serovar Agona str. 311387-1]
MKRNVLLLPLLIFLLI